jgi:hypothetical protein
MMIRNPAVDAMISEISGFPSWKYSDWKDYVGIVAQAAAMEASASLSGASAQKKKKEAEKAFFESFIKEGSQGNTLAKDLLEKHGPEGLLRTCCVPDAFNRMTTDSFGAVARLAEIQGAPMTAKAVRFARDKALTAKKSTFGSLPWWGWGLVGLGGLGVAIALFRRPR